MQTLNQILNTNKFGDDAFYKSLVPAWLYSNLKNNFAQRAYQQEAFGRFVYYINNYKNKSRKPTHLLYQMATGSGKTLVMAGLMIYLYEKGYRNFLFFVNSNNIIDKTRDNFLNRSSSKYLFAKTISIGDKQIKIKEVQNFQAANQDDINIVFSTIQGLHSRLNNPKENSFTYDDFEDEKIVLISDEAHHINATTKKSGDLSAEEKEEIVSWEGTVNNILHANADNILLEFTATIDLSILEIAAKYKDKIIYDYSLKQFRNDGYSKEVKVLQADVSPFYRALQGILLSQYRRKIFEKNKLHIKPVILFKSKTIKDSQAFFNEFKNNIKSLAVADLQRIQCSKTDVSIAKVFQYLKANKISLENFLVELKEDFSENKLISVNSKDESEQKQLAINSLEDEANEYRAVFAVDKLNEGWDVLNLFDIVRLYNSQDKKNNKTTMAEAQLIGRGARYCPFKITEEQPFFCRKYDDDIANELRICEELYYHSAYNPKYIDELNSALEEIGIKAKGDEKKKDRPKKKNGNEFSGNKTKRSSNNSFKQFDFNKQIFKVALQTGYSTSGFIFDSIENKSINTVEQQYNLSDFEEHIIRKGINKLVFYQFSNLKKIFPKLDSINELINSKDYLGNIKLSITALPSQLENLTAKEKLETVIQILQQVQDLIVKNKPNLLQQ